MDVPRKDARRKRLIRRTVLTVAVIALVSAMTIVLGRLEPAAPYVERPTVVVESVKRGPMVIQVRGLGTLVPEEFLWLPASTDGRVDKILLRPGALVKPDSVILTMSNPELEVASVEAEFQVKAAEARYQDLEVQLRSQRLMQQAEVARMESEHAQATLRADRDELLHREQLLVELNMKLSRAAAEEWGKRLALERERLNIQADAMEAQLAVQRAEIDKLRALAQLKREQIDALTLRAGAEGVLQELPVQEGQKLAAGTILAKVAQPARLKAELKIPETQAKDLVIGQGAQIDTRNGVVEGRVARIDPAAREGTVLVDIRLEGQLPPGARPDLSVDGTVEIERLDDVVYVGRPAFGQSNSLVTMFKLLPATGEAVRVPVRFGRASVSTVEIQEGLAVGDQVILSDMSSWDGHDRVRLGN
jgi:HlyD family secretion protein